MTPIDKNRKIKKDVVYVGSLNKERKINLIIYTICTRKYRRIEELII